MVLLMLALQAQAADLPPPTVSIDDAGRVVGTVQLATSAEKLRADMDDPTFVPRATGNGTEITVDARDGDCLVVTSVTPQKMMTVRTTTRRCPTADGWSSTLETSNALDAFVETWSVAPVGDGASVTYRVELSTSVWGVPDAIVRKTTRSSIQSMLEGLQRWSLQKGS